MARVYKGYEAICVGHQHGITYRDSRQVEERKFYNGLT